MADYDIIFKYFPAMDEKRRPVWRVERTHQRDLAPRYRQPLHRPHPPQPRHSIVPRPARAGHHIPRLGTGGGLPGIPLAIAYPGCSFQIPPHRPHRKENTRGIGDSRSYRTGQRHIPARRYRRMPRTLQLRREPSRDDTRRTRTAYNKKHRTRPPWSEPLYRRTCLS